MSEVTTPRFNALTDRWLPLKAAAGSIDWASPVEVLCGEKDGSELDYPRDDFKVYAQLLLSALVQALFPAKNKDELIRRLQTPLLRADVEAAIAPLLSEFDLFGPTPLLQVVAPAVAPDKGAAPFVFPPADLYQPQTPIDGIALPIALVTLFIEQTYAGGAGRGYGAGPGGQPGAFTVIDGGSIRRSAWANSLTLDAVKRRGYPEDRAHAWNNAKQTARPRAAIGIVDGLFFQPRSIWLIPIGAGVCSFTGSPASLVRLSPFLPKSELTKKPTKGEDVWTHPCAPMAVNSQGLAPVRLNAERPAWTGLAQLLAPVSRAKTKIVHPLEGPAPVLTQWKALGTGAKSPRLMLLDFDRDKANVRRRFFEAYPLTQDFLGNRELIEMLRGLASDAQSIAQALEKALSRAHDDRRTGGLALADARTSFWEESERPFWAWLGVASVSDLSTDAGFSLLQERRDQMMQTLRRVALSTFDAEAEVSEFDPRKQERVAKARRGLRKTLWPAPLPAVNPTPRKKVMND